MSWDWGQQYLPRSIHTTLDEFHAALGLLQEYKFIDYNGATPAVLGFGLLLRECWRAVEVESDDEDAPNFLQESLLGTKRANQVITAIKEVIGKLPLSGISEVKSKEKEQKSNVEGRNLKAKTSRKKPEITSPAKNARSQRQRKPSKKLRDSN